MTNKKSTNKTTKSAKKVVMETKKYEKLTPLQKERIFSNIITSLSIPVYIFVVMYNTSLSFKKKINNTIIDSFIKQGYLKVM